MDTPFAAAATGHRRRLALAGAVNFRDIGGYPGVDGRSIRWGRLYRSDSLAELTDDDLPALSAIGLHTLIDLRHEHERQHRPNRHLGATAPTIHALGFYPSGTERLMERVRSRSINPIEVAEVFVEAYRRLPLEQAPAYRGLMEVLARPAALPALIHCTSGKDRTGFAVAVVMMALGVSRAWILEDYQLTNHYRRDLSFMLGQDADPMVVEVVTRADPAFLRAAFASIDAHWGGEEGFLREGLGLDEALRARLRAQLLEDAPA